MPDKILIVYFIYMPCLLQPGLNSSTYMIQPMTGCNYGACDWPRISKVHIRSNYSNVTRPYTRDETAYNHSLIVFTVHLATKYHLKKSKNHVTKDNDGSSFGIHSCSAAYLISRCFQ